MEKIESSQIGHAELVVSWYQQKLAEANEQNANLWAHNLKLTEALKVATAKEDPNLFDMDKES